MARGDFPRWRRNVILVEWFNTNRSYHEDLSPQLAIALAIAVPIAVAATAKSSAAPINGTSIKAAVPAVATDVRYRVRRDHPYPSYWLSHL